MQVVIYALAVIGGLTVVLAVGVLLISIAAAKNAPEEDDTWDNPCEGCSMREKAMAERSRSK